MTRLNKIMRKNAVPVLARESDKGMKTTTVLTTDKRKLQSQRAQNSKERAYESYKSEKRKL